MPRRRAVQKREFPPDERYGSPLVTRLQNTIMGRGKKSIAVRIVAEAFATVSDKLQKGDPVDCLTVALQNVSPKLEVKSRRVGGATYQVPVEVNFERQQSLGIRWLVDAARGRKGVAMAPALAAEIVDAYNNTGNVVKKKEDTHKMAQANRAFAHLKW
jgi:small subunit ribosomal protein S7